MTRGARQTAWTRHRSIDGCSGELRQGGRAARRSDGPALGRRPGRDGRLEARCLRRLPGAASNAGRRSPRRRGIVQALRRAFTDSDASAQGRRGEPSPRSRRSADLRRRRRPALRRRCRTAGPVARYPRRRAAELDSVERCHGRHCPARALTDRSEPDRSEPLEPPRWRPRSSSPGAPPPTTARPSPP